MKGLLAEVDFEVRDGMSIDQFILASAARHCCFSSAFAHILLKQIVRSALSHIEEAADDSDVLEAWISLGACKAQFFARKLTLTPAGPGGSPDKTGNIKTSKLSGVFAEFELAVDLSKSVSARAPRADPSSMPSICFCRWQLPTAKAPTSRRSKLC